MGETFITGDPHGDFRQIIGFSDMGHMQPDDTLIILGDVGLNYTNDRRDRERKEILSYVVCNVLCVHGNHEMRPTDNLKCKYELREWNEGQVYVDPDFPKLKMAKDGEFYIINGREYFVIGGAYSVDKHYRLNNGLNWFSSEQPDEKIRARCLEQLKNHQWRTDIVLSHTCPQKYVPAEAFLSCIDQSEVDRSTEEFLDDIENSLTYNKWFCGHWHLEKTIEKMRFIFHDFIEA